MLPPERVQAAVSLLDRSRDKSLYEKKVIGHVTEGHHSTSIVRINVRRVNFKWQRGTKIGNIICPLYYMSFILYSLYIICPLYYISFILHVLYIIYPLYYMSFILYILYII